MWHMVYVLFVTIEFCGLGPLLVIWAESHVRIFELFVWAMFIGLIGNRLRLHVLVCVLHHRETIWNFPNTPPINITFFILSPPPPFPSPSPSTSNQPSFSPTFLFSSLYLSLTMRLETPKSSGQELQFRPSLAFAQITKVDHLFEFFDFNRLEFR